MPSPPQLPPADQVAVLGEALAAARAITNEDSRARALRALASQLPPADQVAVLGEALAAAGTVDFSVVMNHPGFVRGWVVPRALAPGSCSDEGSTRFRLRSAVGIPTPSGVSSD